MDSSIGIMKKRFSCRKYLEISIEAGVREKLVHFLDNQTVGPFGSRIRFTLIAAEEEDKHALEGLRTYGIIRSPQGFVIGAAGPGHRNLEDFGYTMEQAVLTATGLGLGTCWIGGTFNKSAFAQKMNLAEDETMPAAAAIGYIADKEKAAAKLANIKRLPADKLFFSEAFGAPLPLAPSDPYTAVLDAVRIAPSASNKQPWRILRQNQTWHFYLQRNKGYGQDSLVGRWLGVADLQRVDVGIAMCHFELAARELGLPGRWDIAEPAIRKPDSLTEYTASWITG
mgnify:CR=1 FL=1